MNKVFEKLIQYFPIAKLPFTLEKGSEHAFGIANDALPSVLFEELIEPNLPFEVDEFTEMLPGYHWRLESGQFIFCFWVARLLRHSFYLFSYDENGNWLDDAEIAGLFYEKDQIIHRIANISDPNTVYIVEAEMPKGSALIDASSTGKWIIELQSDGRFIQMNALDDE